MWERGTYADFLNKTPGTVAGYEARGIEMLRDHVDRALTSGGALQSSAGSGSSSGRSRPIGFLAALLVVVGIIAAAGQGDNERGDPASKPRQLAGSSPPSAARSLSDREQRMIFALEQFIAETRRSGVPATSGLAGTGLRATSVAEPAVYNRYGQPCRRLTTRVRRPAAAPFVITRTLCRIAPRRWRSIAPHAAG